jgi:hypothetical protein
MGAREGASENPRTFRKEPKGSPEGPGKGSREGEKTTIIWGPHGPGDLGKAPNRTQGGSGRGPKVGLGKGSQSGALEGDPKGSQVRPSSGLEKWN